MLKRTRVLFLVLLVVSSLASAKNKKKNSLPDYVLKAHTVLVLIDPLAGTSIDDPLANKKAQDDVEKAILKWGRLNPVLRAEDADLVITVRRSSGKIAQPTIGGLPTNDRPVIVQQTDSSIRIGAQQGRNPDAAQQGAQDTRPAVGTEIAPPEDVLVVYPGHQGTDVMNLAIAWRYDGKNALKSPDVPAITEFRKTIEEAEKQQKSKP